MYTKEQCYKDVENILKRPINSMEYDFITNWFTRYDSTYVNTCVNLAKQYPEVRYVKFIDSICYSHWTFYSELLNVRGNVETPSISQSAKPIEEKKTRTWRDDMQEFERMSNERDNQNGGNH